MASRALKTDIRKAGSADVEPQRTAAATDQEVAARAYELWQQRGCPAGSDQEDWFQAEKELMAGKAKR